MGHQRTTRRLAALERATPVRPDAAERWPTLVAWRAERNTPDFAARYPWIGARRAAAAEAEAAALEARSTL